MKSERRQFVPMALFLSCLILVFTIRSAVGKRLFTDEELEAWEPPKEIKQDYPYYYAGKDYDGLPVIVLEFGKWPFRKTLLNGGENAAALLDKYFEQIVVTWTKTAIEAKSTNDTDTATLGVICDFEGFDTAQLAYVPTVRLLAAAILKHHSHLLPLLEYVQMINVNYVAESLIALLKPVLGELLTKIEISGTNKQKWVPILLRKIPPESLPPWYGGADDFKPIAVYG